MKKAQEWIKCPRCELNYILKKDKYCDVCKQEMKAGALSVDDNLDDDFGEDEEMILCPICKINYISPNETACKSCLEEGLVNEDMDSDDWRSYVDKAGDSSEDDDLDLLPTDDDEMSEELDDTFGKDLDEDYEDEEENEDESADDYEDDFEDVDFDDEGDDEDYEENEDESADDYEDDDEY